MIIKNKFLFIGIVFAILLQNQISSADIQCPVFKEVDKNVEVCDDNHKLAKAGSDCLNLFDALLAKKINVPVAQLRKITPKEFRKKLANKADLEMILKDLEKAQSSVREYKDNLIFPEDFDAPEEVLGTKNIDFIQSSPCFAKSEDELMEAEAALKIYQRIFSKIATP